MADILINKFKVVMQEVSCCFCLKGSRLFCSGSVEQEQLSSRTALTPTLEMKFRNE